MWDSDHQLVNCSHFGWKFQPRPFVIKLQITPLKLPTADVTAVGTAAICLVLLTVSEHLLSYISVGLVLTLLILLYNICTACLSFSINIRTGCSDENRNWCTVGTVGLTVSVTGERYGRETVGTIAIAAIDKQHYTSTQLHIIFFCDVHLI